MILTREGRICISHQIMVLIIHFHQIFLIFHILTHLVGGLQYAPCEFHTRGGGLRIQPHNVIQSQSREVSHAKYEHRYYQPDCWSDSGHLRMI